MAMKRNPTKKSSAPVSAPTADASKYALPHELVNCAYVQNSAALEPWAGIFGTLNMNELAADLKAATFRVTKDGSLLEAEAMLYGQAVALQTVFSNLSRRAALNAGGHMQACETYLRLALKAQAQCRATLETLHEMKNPRPLAFVRQANIAHGPQQVNNGPAPPKGEQYAPASAHPGETVSAPTELLEDLTHGRTQLDTRAAPAASPAHPQLVPVGALDRPAHP